jgi:hypothetical protein
LPGVRTVIAIGVVAGCLTVAACGGDDDEETTAAALPATTEEETTAGKPPGETTVEVGEPGQGPEGAAQRPTSIEDVITAVFTGSEEPALLCDELVTERFVRQAYGAREGCLAAQQPGALAGTVEVQNVTGSGQSASAVAVPSGGPYDGVEVDVELVADPAAGGAWQLDSLIADVPAGP